MDVSSINSDLIRGNVTTIILKALAADDRYGYDILREIDVKSGGQYKLKQPTLYSCLKRLEKQGLISSYWGEENDTEGGRRRYYSLTDAGKAYLNKMQSEYEYSRTILDSLLSEEKFDFEKSDAPFDINSLRPYTKRTSADGDEEVVSAKADVPAPEKVADKPEIDKPAEVSQEVPRQTMFEPLDRGESSYDKGYRRTNRSVFDIVGEITSIMGGKTAEPDEKVSAQAQTEEKDTRPADDKLEALLGDDVEETLAPIEQPARRESILTPREMPAPVTAEDVEAERMRREEAKRALGIGYGEKPDPVKLYEEAQKKTEIIDKKQEIQENQQEIRDRAATRELLFGNRDNAPKEDSSYLDDLPDGRTLLDKYNKKEEAPAPVPHEKPVTQLKSEITSQVPASNFSFRKDETQVVNYRDAFSVLRDKPEKEDDEEDSAEIKQKPASSIDLKTKLFSEGYKLRPYTRENTENYYSLNYIKKNRINRDSYAILYVLICLEVLVGWLIFKDRFSDMAYAAVCIIALLVPAIPFVVWSMNPDKRVRANYNFRASILNRLMLYLNLLVIVCLIGFFGFGASINDGGSMIAPILVPALLLLNIPLSSVIILILYNTKKYHIS